MSTSDAPADPQALGVTGDATPAATDALLGCVEVVVGRIVRAHGLRGDVLVDVHTDEPARRFACGARFETARGPVTVRVAHRHGTRLIVGFDGVADRESAEALRALELWLAVDPDERPDDPEEFYDHQVVGLAVVAADGRLVGRVAEVLHLPAQDVLSVRRVNGRECLIPFVADLVPTVDLGSRRLTLAAAAEELVIDEPPASHTVGNDQMAR